MLILWDVILNYWPHKEKQMNGRTEKYTVRVVASSEFLARKYAFEAFEKDFGQRLVGLKEISQLRKLPDNTLLKKGVQSRHWIVLA